MGAQSILQITSGFKPSIDGMGDFARLLGGALWGEYQVRTHFLIYKRPSKTFDGLGIEPNSYSYPAEPNPDAWLQEAFRIVEQQKPQCAVLHYGPYGYSSQGNPGAFCDAVERLAERLKLVVFFHESYSSGPPWKRAFWTEREQKQTIVRLQKLAQCSFTSNEKYLRRMRPAQPAVRPLIQIPIFSNMGEPREIPPLTARKRQLVVFGQFATRLRLYQARNVMEDLCRWLQIERVIDIGSGDGAGVPDAIAGVRVDRMGRLDEAEVSRLLVESIAGVVGYWPDVWEKSGVIAAYEAHGLVPVLVPMEPRHFPKPVYLPFVEAEELDLLRGADGTIGDSSLKSIVDKTIAYYRDHQSVTHCARMMVPYLRAE